jgi:hypothetical protein
MVSVESTASVSGTEAPAFGLIVLAILIGAHVDVLSGCRFVVHLAHFKRGEQTWAGLNYENRNHVGKLGYCQGWGQRCGGSTLGCNIELHHRVSARYDGATASHPANVLSIPARVIVA